MQWLPPRLPPRLVSLFCRPRALFLFLLPRFRFNPVLRCNVTSPCVPMRRVSVRRVVLRLLLLFLLFHHQHHILLRVPRSDFHTLRFCLVVFFSWLPSFLSLLTFSLPPPSFVTPAFCCSLIFVLRLSSSCVSLFICALCLFCSQSRTPSYSKRCEQWIIIVPRRHSLPVLTRCCVLTL